MNTVRTSAVAVDAEALLAMIHGGWASQAVCAAVTLRLPDHLAAGPHTPAALARAAHCHVDSLSRLLRALASLDIVHDCADGTYMLSATGQYLRSDSLNSVAGQAEWFGRYSWPLWGELVESVQTGVSARVRANGSGGYGHLLANPGAAEVFNRAMRDLTRIVASSVVSAYDFSGVRTIIDVGGGHGELLVAILTAWPKTEGTILELAHAIPGAREHVRDAGLGHRCSAEQGDFFTEIPAGADVYLLKAVLHNWDDDHCSRILRTLSRAATAHARLLVIERVLPDRVQPTALHQAVARSDLNMLVGVGGRERTQSELTSMLQDAGFGAVTFTPLSGAFNLIEARR